MALNISQAHIATAITIGLINVAAYYTFVMYQKYQRKKIPTEWTQVGSLTHIFVYPIKSCAPILLEQAECSILGLRDNWLRDRVLMVIDEKNNFFHARTYPQLLLVQASVRNSILTLKYGDDEEVHVNLAEVVALGKRETAYVWSVPVPVYNCGAEASQFFARILGRSPENTRLAYYASENSRPLRAHQEKKVYAFTKTDTGAMPDEVPYNLVNQASVDELKERVKDCNFTVRNFRPNFVLNGAKPYDEDNWKFIKIGENVFEVIKPCFRCILTTIDPETGERDSKSEPLQTLKSYRQTTVPAERAISGNAPRMGLQMSLRSGPGGIVAINQAIYVSYK